MIAKNCALKKTQNVGYFFLTTRTKKRKDESLVDEMVLFSIDIVDD